MKNIVLKLELYDDKAKQKALKTVASLPGIDLISMDMKEKQLFVTGRVNPVDVVSKLRKFWPKTELHTFGAPKEPEKKEPKKEEEKTPEAIMEMIRFCKQMQQYNPYMPRCYYHTPSIEDNPNACTIV